ncbi:uncharacterized protein LOC117760573 [Hippoglossus hippoglossus]|uniref:uncharacterized protein LOC117760573 n=1 Tax=Hippoglossus hippoglossus TaxID=8267 RepID=UPI00148CA5BB|nr:uncharacterized protein LOC117760573 [Hippoglossus hippoglossus]
MRLILVKPTNATRRLDSTGEVFPNGDHEHCASGGPPPPTRTPEHDQYSGTPVEASSSPQETSLCCVAPSPHEKSNGINQVSNQMSPLKTRNLTLSQLSDQEWLLLCGQVSSVGDDSPSAERGGTSGGHPNHNDRCGCSCPDAHQHPQTFQPASSLGTVQDCPSRVSSKRRLSCSPHTQSFSQSSQGSTSCQVLPQQTNQTDLFKPATNQPHDNFMPQCSDHDGQKELSQRQHPCNHFKLKDSSQATCPNLFNIPLNSVECAESNQILHQRPQPAVTADLNWREIFGKEPLLVQQRQNRDSRGSMTGDQACKSPGDPSIILKCRHLPYNLLTSTARMKRSSTPDKSVQSFSISQYSSLENQDLVEERAKQGQSQTSSELLGGSKVSLSKHSPLPADNLETSGSVNGDAVRPLSSYGALRSSLADLPSGQQPLQLLNSAILEDAFSKVLREDST